MGKDAQLVPPTWHAACAIAASFGVPIFASTLLVAAATDIEEWWWAAFTVLVLLFPFLVGHELLARSLVEVKRGSLRGWAAELDIAAMRVRLLSWDCLRSSLLTTRLTPRYVLLARRLVWGISLVIAVSGLVTGLR